MVKDIYPKSEQRIYFQREQAYGEIYDPEAELTAFTSVPDDYPHWRRLDFIPDATDIVIPFVEKLAQYDIQDGKHPGAIFSGNIEPQEFTLDCSAQALEFLAFAIGAPSTSSHTRAMTQVLTFTDATPAQGTYFLFDVIETGGNINHYGVWSDTANDQATGKPTLTGINASKMLPANTNAVATVEDVADAVEAIIEATLGGGGTSDITSADNVLGVLTLIHARSGAVQIAHDGEAVFGLTTVSPTTFGATNYTVTEGLSYSLPSFTMRVEQRNPGDNSEDIIYDLFGCVIEEITINVDYGEKIVKASVLVKCPYAIENTTHGRADIPPPKKYLNAFPTMSALQEDTAEYVIMEGTTDRTPRQVDKVMLRIKNNVTFKPDISKKYKNLAIAGKRDVEMEIIGSTDEKELFKYWQEAYTISGGDWIPENASGKLNTKFRLDRDATYDYLIISVYNWLIQEHNFHFVSVDEAVKAVEMKFIDGSPDGNGRIIDSCTFVSPIDQCVFTYNA